jgi:hypothetical protein
VDDQEGTPDPLLTKAYPRPSTATHNPAGAQETALSDSPGSVGATLQVGEELVGSDVLSALPSWSTATHSDSEAQAMALGLALEGNASGRDHASEDAAREAAGAAAPVSANASPSTSAVSTGRIGRARLGRLPLRPGSSGGLVISVTPSVSVCRQRCWVLALR